MNISIIKNENGYDSVVITTKEGSFEMYLQSIYKFCIRCESKRYTITKDDYQIYEAFNNLYKAAQQSKLFVCVEFVDKIDINDKSKYEDDKPVGILKISKNSEDEIVICFETIKKEEVSYPIYTFDYEENENGHKVYIAPIVSTYDELRRYSSQITFEELDFYAKQRTRKC